MRTSMWIAAALAAVGCGKQLNPEFCQNHPKDLDCLDAGLVSIDAPPACRGDLDCANVTGRTVCDLQYGECVQCTATENTCPVNMHVCGRDDQCHGCVSDSDCAPQICITGTGMCSQPGDMVFYVAPNGTGTTCSAAARCTLDTAIDKVAMGLGSLIVAAGGTYTGPYVLPAKTIIIQGSSPLGQTPDVTLTSVMDNQPVVKVASGGNAELDNLVLTGARNGDGIDCMGATLRLHHVYVTNNDKQGVHVDGCTLTVDHGYVTQNADTGISINNAPTITIYDNYISQNGTDKAVGGMKIAGATSGRVRFNTIAYNTAKNGAGNIAGVVCTLQTSNTVDLLDDLLAQNTNNGLTNYSGNCATGATTVNTDENGAHFKSPPTDLRLTDETNSPQILNNDNGQTSCGNPMTDLVTDDFEGETRPQDGHCDIGADEHKKSD